MRHGGLHRTIHYIITYGEEPSRILPIAQQWNEHLDQYQRDYGTIAWLIELIRSSAAHLWWRLNSSTQKSTLPIGLLSIAAATGSAALLMSGFEDFLSVAAETHSATGLFVIGVALAIQPWKLSWRRIPPAALACATGLAHLAYSLNIFIWFDILLVAGLLSASAGLTYIGISGLRNRMALGQTRAGLWLVMAGATTIAAAQLLWAFRPTNQIYAVSSVIIAWACMIIGIRIVDLWDMQHPHQTSRPGLTGRLLGYGRPRTHRRPDDIAPLP